MSDCLFYDLTCEGKDCIECDLSVDFSSSICYNSNIERGHEKMQNSRKTIGTYFVDDLETTIRTLENFRYEVLDGDYDGWGIDDNMILVVKGFIENLKNGVYSE